MDVKTSVWTHAALLAIGIAFHSHETRAVTISSETGVSKSVLVETISGEGEVKQTESEKWKWGLSDSLTHTRTEPGAISTALEDDTNEASARLAWASESGLTAGGEVSYSTTPAEALQSRAISLHLSHQLMLEDDTNRESGEGDEADPATLGFRMEVGTRLYQQTFSSSNGGRRGVLFRRPSSGSNELRQYEIGAGLRLSPSERWEIELSGRNYVYDKNVAEFLKYLDSPTAIATGKESLSQTVSGLPQASVGISGTYALNEKWEADLSQSMTTQAADQKSAWTTRVMLAWSYSEKFKFGFGAERSSSPTSLTETMGLFAVDGRF